MLLILNFTGVALATVGTYTNSGANFYSIPGTPPPAIDATNFVNVNIFSVGFGEPGVNAQFYEPKNTVNYTNASTGFGAGLMSVNSASFSTIFGFITFSSIGVGFQFDTLTTNTIAHRMAGTFDNEGTIRCDSFLDGNPVLFDVGQCLVWATNILCPGNIEVSEDGFMSFTGQNVNLSNSVLTIESPENLSGIIGNAAFGGSGIFGVNSNLWDPSAELGQNFADSAFFPIAPFFLDLTNSLPYNQQQGLVNRSAFVQDNSGSNVTYSVYFGPVPALGSGDVTIGWVGKYLNFSTGQFVTNYLYLNDDYLLGASTNVAFGNNGYPNNFKLTEFSTPFPGLPNPSTPNLPFFPSGGITNAYSYGTFQSLDVTETNPSASNPSGSITNLPARMQITAGNELNLNQAQVTGANYLAITATNQFDGSDGATIGAAFSDINIGRTNGSMSVSNLMESQIPDWTGNIQAWSTRWLSVATNGTGTNAVVVTNDWRVLLVNSQLTPVSTPQIRNLTFNVTNNLVVSDALNVYGTFFANAQVLTLTTNVLGVGASSPDGELNFQNQNPNTWSWNGSFPNLLYLTNNGAIRMPNFSDFVSSTQIVTITTNIPAIAAIATLTEQGITNVATNSTVSVGGTSYIFVSKLTNSLPYQVLIGATFDSSISNLIAAINVGAGSGTLYSSSTFANSTATAGLLTSHAFAVSANTGNYPGTLGNGIPVSSSVPSNLKWSGSALSGGVNAIAGTTNVTTSAVPFGAIVNNGLLADVGSTILANNFQNGGVISNSTGSFILTSQTTTLTNGSIIAGGDVSITANTLNISNLMLVAGRSLTLDVTNSLTDNGVTNGSVWSLGTTNGTGGNGLILPILPTNTVPGTNNLLGTTISMISPGPNKTISSTWAANDYGVSTIGYNTNNVAIGQLILTALAPQSKFFFGGPGPSSNAIYVDRLVLNNYAGLANVNGADVIPAFNFNNVVIYYGDAQSSSTVNGGPLIESSYELNEANGGHFRWVPQYTGFFSSTNLVYQNGTTNTLNIGLVTSPFLDSNGNGIPNSADQNPFFVSSQINFNSLMTNGMDELTWDSIPSSTNTVYLSTNMASWNVVTNFVSPSPVPPVGGWPITNILFEPLVGPMSFYRVAVTPNSVDAYGH